MIFHSPKKLISVAKAFSPAWITNLSPARLFTSNPTRDESIILDPPAWPDDVARDEFWENGAPIAPQRRLKRCYGPNGSFHRSIHLKQLQANRAWNVYQKKRSRYEAQQARRNRLEELNKPVPLAELHVQAMQKLHDSNDPEDRIFLRELGQLHNQTDNLEKFARVDKMIKSFQEYREQHRARVEYAALSARKPHTAPSFSTFQRERRSRAIQEAAARKRQQAQREQPDAEDRQSKERTEKERKKEEYEEQRAREREAGRLYMEKVREQAHREEIRIALEQGRPPPDHLRHRQDLIQEIAQVVTKTALHRQQEAARRADNEREQRFARQREARRRAEEDEARRRAHELEARRRAEEDEARRRAHELEVRRRVEQEARRYAEERASAIAELYARRQAKLAEERAAQEAERQRREQEEAQRRRDEQAAREEEARRAQEEARRAAEEEARRHQAQQEQAGHTLQGAPSAQIFKLYDNKWAALRGAEVYSDITFAQFPWPVLYEVSDISGITLDSVRAFFAHRGTTGRAMKAEILKWHPDKFNNQLHQVHAGHREQVREAGELVAKFLNNIMEN
ncbi:hypothetical protein C0993_009401 [Termitomyces sp. T159_Od127]|nr:hypothetical protein C0993_009401 [Termitomyces sp. T159_Od127]